MIRRIKVSGNSLSPDYEEGDFVITVKIPLFLRWLRPGDVVVLTQPPYGTLIKQVAWIDTILKLVYVVGKHDASIDSRTFGPIPERNILGKVIWHIRHPDEYAAQ